MDLRALACRGRLLSLDRRRGVGGAIAHGYQAALEDGFDVVAVSVDSAPIAGDAADLVREFANQYGLTFPILLDPESHIENVFAVAGLPMSWLIDRTGRIRGRFIGPREWDDPEVETEIRSLLES